MKDFVRDGLEFKVVKSCGLTAEEAFERSGIVDYITHYLAPVREVEREYYFFGWM